MLTRIQLSAILIVAVFVWAVALVVQGVAVSWTWLRPFTIVLAVLVVILGLVERWLWRLRFVQPWLVHMPNVRGTWRAKIQPTGSEMSSLDGYMVIRQTHSTISLRLLTAESASEILAAKVIKADDATFSIAGVYRNTPKLSVRAGSPAHYGAILLTIHGEPPVSLDGQYWTDRSSQGEIILSHRRRRLAHSYEEATKAEKAS